MNYDVEFFIKYFEAIQEYKWCKNIIMNEKGQKCAIGHCLYKPNAKPVYYVIELKNSPLNIFGEDMIKALIDILPSIAEINDGNSKNYQQPTPKQRVLAALYDLQGKPRHEVHYSVQINAEFPISSEITNN